MSIAYVVKRYPRFSETFIVNEVLAHEEAGLPLEIFSLRPPVDTHFQDLISRVRAPLTYLSNGTVKAESLWTQARQLSRHGQILAPHIDALLEESALDAQCAITLADHVLQRGITHIHAHFASSAATVARLAAKLAGVGYSITAHAKDIFHESVQEHDLQQKIADSEVTFTVSEFNLNNLRERFPAQSDKIVRLYNGMHLPDFSFDNPVHRAPRIVAVGRLVEKKGFCDLISACQILKDQGKSFECLIVGGGDLEADLLQQIDSLQLQHHVRILGPMPQKEVKRLVQSAAVLAAPCVEGGDGNKDGLPTVLLEAMSLGTPCVSTPVTGIPEAITNDQTGILVPANQPSALAAALDRVIADPELRQRLAAAARQRIEKDFDIVRNAQRQREWFDVQQRSHSVDSTLVGSCQ